MPRHACWIGDVRTSLSFKSQATPLTGILKTDLSPIVARRAVEITDNPSLGTLSTWTHWYEYSQRHPTQRQKFYASSYSRDLKQATSFSVSVRCV
uniref:Uncharacterized protein n=1 Tax=Populus trichocarpa TaxID=3694 RepID=A0A3N7FUR1_POPTR